MFLLEVVEAFTTARVPYAVAGGYAVSLHGAVRGTLDIDFVISLKPKHLKASEEALQSIGLRSRLPISHIEISQFRDEYIKKRNLIAWGFVANDDPTRMVDLILVEDISKQKIVTKVVQGVSVKVLSLQSLIRMKTLSGRAQDLEDVRALKVLK